MQIVQDVLFVVLKASPSVAFYLAHTQSHCSGKRQGEVHKTCEALHIDHGQERKLPI